MKFLRLMLIYLLLFFGREGLAQQVNKDSLANTSNNASNITPIMLPTTIVDGERIPWILLREVVITDYRIFKTPADRARYNRLKYNVLKVLPYAKFAEDRYDKLQRDLAVTPKKKDQKRLIKDCEKEIKAMFNREIKNMSVSQGEILIKLINRQTGNSSYELVKELRGGVSAFFYQSVAKIFGHNLKNTYDPDEDREIETIIRNYANNNRYFY
ncbi:MULTISPECIES: DUF4294 domain-containing protein [Olivibacter]|jgi:hypothetical protein|uniref:DUF4294 domain-containing protein n=2 Tax=Sphingobacteriaceae TaxID=84566 RepID=F4C3T2_SPHS2|nr:MULTISPECIES: DUF4294 domain-containing protein [Olivibacter]MDM8174860.1 DUF4294 domain-containing protein [Olivibacter sp. 47]QEL01646.1 DUF4294 domain-containing protein [Olivibacter sp. LS-1]